MSVPGGATWQEANEARANLDIARIGFVGRSCLPLILLGLAAGAERTSAQEAAAAEPSAHHEERSFPLSREALEQLEAQRNPLEIRTGGMRLQFGGFAKVDFIQDFDYIGNEDQFKVSSIAVDGDPNALLGGSTNVSAKQTRFDLDIHSEAAGGYRVYLEGDFFGSGSSFRLRHGYGQWGGLLAGQTWTTFQDITTRPFTLDYEGPDTEVFIRQGMIRYTGGTDAFGWSVAAEDPDSQISTATGIAGVGRSELPDIVGRIRLGREWGHLQLAGLVRQLRFVSNDGSVDETTTGYGINLAAKANAFGDDSIMGHVVVGSGIGRYIEAMNGAASDAFLTAGGSLEALDGWAAVIGYTRQWNAEWASTFSGGPAKIDTNPGQPGSALESVRSVHANLAYQPTPLVLIGGELMWGQRENSNGSDGDALRFQFSVQYNFR
jgi:hypothetical protein